MVIRGLRLFHGVMRGKSYGRFMHKTVQASIDGAIARFYTMREWSELAGTEGLHVDWVRVYGDKVEMVTMTDGRVKAHAIRLITDSVARMFVHRLRQRTFWSHNNAADVSTSYATRRLEGLAKRRLRRPRRTWPGNGRTESYHRHASEVSASSKLMSGSSIVRATVARWAMDNPNHPRRQSSPAATPRASTSSR